MRFMHISDLHLGKSVNEFSMLEDQSFILSRLLEICDCEKPDAVLIAGDIYDKPSPPAEAVALFDGFLTALSGRGLDIFVLSGNHDSAERLAFGARLMQGSGVHLAPVYDGTVQPIPLKDDYGPVFVYMLPFVRPGSVRRFFPDVRIESYNDALRTAVSGIAVDVSQRNVLLAHQFVTGAVRSESEEISVGGLDNVDGRLFDPFDYVALGHLHTPQSVLRETMRYCGTPLKYSFSEAKDQKSALLIDLGKKGSVHIRSMPLKPLRDMRILRGTYEEITFRPNYEAAPREDYLHVVLTDEEEIPDALAKLRILYPNIMKLTYDNRRAHIAGDFGEIPPETQNTPLEMLEALYEKQNNRPMSPQQIEFSAGLIAKIWGD